MITLRFVSHPGVFNLACQFAQYGFWCTHCDAVMPDGNYLGAMSDGVKIRPNKLDAGAFSREQFVSVKKTSPEQEGIFYAFLNRQIGKPYDFKAIIAFYSKRSGRDWQSDDSWFCSELIGAALAECGIFPKELAVQFSRITVRDLMLLTSTLTEVS